MLANEIKLNTHDILGSDFTTTINKKTTARKPNICINMPTEKNPAALYY